MRTFSSLRQYLADFASKWDMLQTKGVEKLKFYIQ